MKRFSLLVLLTGLLLPLTMIMNTVKAQSSSDTLAPHVLTLKDKVSGLEERVTTAENDLAKLTKIKLSGYIQAQWQHFEAANAYPSNYFSVRRARLKIVYQPVNGLTFVLQPDFAPGSITIKDAYAVANPKFAKTFSLWAGKFNRPNYEVEYSSSSREVPERTRVVRAIYPDERAIGAKLEFNPQRIPLKVQLAVFNGNDGIGLQQTPSYNYTTNSWDNPGVVQQNVDFDNYKDLMLRATYGFKFGNLGGLTVGAHTYYGQIKANSTDLLNSDYSYNKSLDENKVGYVGKGIPKQWVGVEAQLYLDLLGGLALKGEYIFGVNSTPGYHINVKSFTLPSVTTANDTMITVTNTTLTPNNYAPAITRNFMGYYVYLVKNVGKKNQFAVRYDFYNPNTKLGAADVGVAGYDAKVSDVVKDNITYTNSDPVVAINNRTKTTTINKLTSGTADIPYGTWTLAYTYYFDENIKFMIGYEIPMNKQVGTLDSKGVNSVKTDYTVNGVPGRLSYNDVIHQNILTVRMQVKF